MPRKPAVDKTTSLEHTKLIRAATRKLERRRTAAEQAELERDEAIRTAFEAGLDVNPIHQAAGLSKDRAWQIHQRRR